MSFETLRIETGQTSYRVLSFETPYPDRVPLVLLHGFLGAGVLWSDLAETWSRVRPVYSVDLPGHGGSHFRAGPESFAGMVGDLAELLRILFDARPLHLLGYSLGGRLAAGVATLGGYELASLTLESAHPGLTSAAERSERREWENGWLDDLRTLPLVSFVDRWENQPLLQSRRMIAASSKQRIDVMNSQNAANIARVFEAARLSDQPFLDEELRKLHCPVTWIVGDRDTKYLALARRAADEDTPVIAFSGAGHTVHAEQPGRYTQTVYERCRTADAAMTP